MTDLSSSSSFWSSSNSIPDIIDATFDQHQNNDDILYNCDKNDDYNDDDDYNDE